MPSVRARVVNSVVPGQGVEIPSIRLSTLLALNTATLAFPGAVRDGTAHSNLVLTNVLRPEETQGEPVALTVQAYSGQGVPLGTQQVSLAAGQTLFLVDVLRLLEVSSLDNGSVQVRRASGDRAFWGLLYTIDADGGVRVSVGSSP